ncbi:MAG: hypothetical protein AAFP90_04645 [Planctomycetota bacterium]
MSQQDPSQVSPIFRIDVGSETPAPARSEASDTQNLLRELVHGQQQQNQLLSDLVQQMSAANRQRADELQQWRNANPRLSSACRRAADAMGRAQAAFLETMTEEIEDSAEHLVDGEYMLSEFVDRFGPRMAHLHGIMQVLAQLGHGIPMSEDDNV